MDARQQSQVLMSELTRVSAQQDNLKMAIAEAMAGAGESFTVHGPLKSFALHEKEAQLVDEQPASPGIQAGWVEPEATPQAEQAATPKRPEGAETPSMSLDLPRDSFAYLVNRHVAEQAAAAEATAAEATAALAAAPVVQPLPAVTAHPPAAAFTPLAAPSMQPAAALPNSKPVNYSLVNQPETAESREALRNMQAALGTKGDGGARAIDGQYKLGITPGLGDNRDDTQKYHDAQKLEERRKKEAYLLTREAHYQEEQQRLTRIKEVEESEAVTKLLLQAKLAPTPQTAALLAKEREKEKKKAEQWKLQVEKEAKKERKKQEELQKAEEKAASKVRKEEEQKQLALDKEAEKRQQRAAAEKLAEEKKRQKDAEDRQLQEEYNKAMEKKKADEAARALDVYAELAKLKAENQQLKKDITVYEENRLLKQENRDLKAENAQLKDGQH